LKSRKEDGCAREQKTEGRRSPSPPCYAAPATASSAEVARDHRRRFDWSPRREAARFRLQERPARAARRVAGAQQLGDRGRDLQRRDRHGEGAARATRGAELRRGRSRRGRCVALRAGRGARGRARAGCDLERVFQLATGSSGLTSIALSGPGRRRHESFRPDRHYCHLAHDGHEHAIRLIDELNARERPRWTLVDLRGHQVPRVPSSCPSSRGSPNAPTSAVGSCGKCLA
jgi:hypothetical protein